MQGGYTNPNRNRLGGDLLDDADSREQVSLKDALQLLAKLGKTGTLVSDGRKSCAKRPMWNCLLHTSMGVFLIEICDTSHWGQRWRRTRTPGGTIGARARRCYTISLFVSPASRSPSAQQSDVGRRTRTFTVQSGTALGRSGLRNWSECTIIFVCAASEVIRNLKTCICRQWRLIRSTKQQMTSLWKMTQISKLKAGSLECAGHTMESGPLSLRRFVEAGRGIPLNSESPSHGLTLPGPGAWDSGRSGCQGLSGTMVRD